MGKAEDFRKAAIKDPKDGPRGRRPTPGEPLDIPKKGQVGVGIPVKNPDGRHN